MRGAPPPAVSGTEKYLTFDLGCYIEGDDIAKVVSGRDRGGRVPTGIDGFDQLVEGGLPRGSNVLVTGLPGTGKTIFGLNFLYKGAQLGENGLYISIDSSSEQLKLQGLRFGWNLEGMEKSGKLFFLRIPLNKIKFNLFEVIEKIKNEINAERVVLDNLATFAINAGFFAVRLGDGDGIEPSPTPLEAGNVGGDVPDEESGVIYASKSSKRMAYMIVEKLAELGTTNLIITYGNRNSTHITVDGISEFSCDGIVELYNELIGNKHMRTMSVLKMRATAHSPYLHDFEFGKGGIVVKSAEPVYKGSD